MTSKHNYYEYFFIILLYQVYPSRVPKINFTVGLGILESLSLYVLPLIIIRLFKTLSSHCMMLVLQNLFLYLYK